MEKIIFYNDQMRVECKTVGSKVKIVNGSWDLR